MIAGPGDRLEHARNDHQVYFTNHPTETDREYLIHVFDTLRDLGGGAVQDVFGPHNVLRQLPNWLSGDAAGDLLEFFRKIDPNTGQIVHDFTDPDWNTRFLGDLYQDLSKEARKKYALLQTPDFVLEFILDRTLEPALDEFGLTPDTNPEHRFKMIDPACGSGHFLLGSFPRILKRWQEKEPGTPVNDLVQRTLDSIHGVDINPFAIAIARFRLLLVSLQACGITQLGNARGFQMNLACGDSLYHGVKKQQTMDFTDEAHHFNTEDAEELKRILQEGTFHAVVANPPYIVPKDKAANTAYRRLYTSCHRSYALTVPFMERTFNLCVRATPSSPSAGFSGQITSNSFMKAEFGKKLVEEFFPSVELTHVIDTSGAYIPGHGTPTVILFARNRKPVSTKIRTVLGTEGEPGRPIDPATGKVWSAIVNQVDNVPSESDFVSAIDSDRQKFHQHPWSIGGGGASQLKEVIDTQNSTLLKSQIDQVGRTTVTGEEEAWVIDRSTSKRKCVFSHSVPFVVGDSVRDWALNELPFVIYPYEKLGGRPLAFDPAIPTFQHLWLFRRSLKNRSVFNKTLADMGRPWWEHLEHYTNKLRNPRSIVFAFVATHNHFVFDRGGKLFNRPAPVIKLPPECSDEEHFELLELLNSSTVCFLLKQVCHNKGSTVDAHGARQRTSPFEDFYGYNGTKIKQLKVPEERNSAYGTQLTELSKNVLKSSASFAHAKQATSIGSSEYECILTKMMRLQEDLDWECYRLYGLLEDDLTYPADASLGIQLGERAFEIVMARKMAAGELQTTWFERHGSTPITELPNHWPDDYRQLVQRRIDVIESNPQIALIEQPEYKRRWNTTPWEEQVEKALKSWLLDRLESYFDFDGRMLAEPSDDESSDDNPPVKHKLYGTLGDAESPRLVSVAQLADVAAQDEQFMEVAEVYKDDPAFDVQRLVEDLVKPEQVPLLPILRYKPAGLRKRAEWEKTWDLQRLEDAARAGTSMSDPAVTRLIGRCQIKPETIQQIEAWQQRTPETERSDTTLPSARELDAILSIPVPPKYTSGDMISTGGAKYWKLRGKLDVPKERWISFPHCEGTDGTLMLAWAGYDHLQVARAISGHYIDVRDNIGGSDDPRLVPLLAGIMELLPWLHQWHSEIDPEFDLRMNEYYESFVTTGASDAGLSREDIAAWEPPSKRR